MSGMHSDSPNDNTNIIVNSMRHKRRSMRVPIIVGTIGICGLVGIMALGLGSKREDNYKVDNSKPGPATRETLSADGHSQDAAAELGVVEVHLKVPGQLWLDGKNHGSAAHHSLKLEIGPHTLVVKRKGVGAISQMVTVVADKSIAVIFLKNKAQIAEPVAVKVP